MATAVSFPSFEDSFGTQQTSQKRRPNSKRKRGSNGSMDMGMNGGMQLVNLNMVHGHGNNAGDIGKSRVEELEDMIRLHLGTGKFFIVAAALREIDEDKLYEPSTKSIYSYAKAKFQFSRRTTNTYLCSASVYESIVEDYGLPIPCSISHIRSLHKFSEDTRRHIWKLICNSGTNITEETVMSMILKFETGVSFTDLGNELYVPKLVIDAAKKVIGKCQFDLDPASCAFANSVHASNLSNMNRSMSSATQLIATTFFDESMNGLHQKWWGDVWMFPPFGSDGDGTVRQRAWFETAENKFRDGEINSCLALLKVTSSSSSSSSSTTHPNMQSNVGMGMNNINKINATIGNNSNGGNNTWMKYPWCMLNCKLDFLTPTGKEKNVNDESYVVVYLGHNPDSFCREFSKIGFIPGYNSWSGHTYSH
ncbi:hypothetical protein BKA69DRAFT_1090297 [Paraphysoderma sedebokerense]|nr:hypothetical protein BKA69DRAFT_1090297 [Paraphysoderma sedebokerense]